MAKQMSIASFFSKSPGPGKTQGQESPRGNVKLRGKELQLMDLVWAKLDGHPWWPAMVCNSPGEESFMRRNQIHVHFFDQPPTRGWVKDGMVKPYGPAGESGVPSYRDASWVAAVRDAGGAEKLPREDRVMLLVDMLPSDDDDLMEAIDDDENNSDKSKENVVVNGHGGGQASKGEPKAKRRRIILHSDSESEDDYKPDISGDSDDSASSGVDEAQVSGPETESEVDSPIKEPKNKRTKSEPLKTRNLNSSLSSSPRSTSSPNTPKLSSTTKSKLAMFAAKEAPPPAKPAKEEDWPFLKEPWLQPKNIMDRARRRPDHPEYDPRTLHVPDSFLAQQTPGMRQWWELKSRHSDMVLFFKMGKFYELFHMDAVMGVQELGLIMMKGEKAHSGFPEVAYSRYSTALIEKGYKVARIEQTETPEMMEKRCKNLARPTRFDRVVRREICQKTSRGTRVYGALDGDECEASTAHLLALAEKPAKGSSELSEYGVAFVDTSIGTFYLGQFVDDCHTSRLRTLLAHHPVAQILTERGGVSAKTKQVVNALVPQNLREVLVPEKEFWTATKTLGFLVEGPYFKGEGEADTQWPPVLKGMMDEGDSLGRTPQEGSELALSAMGALTWYLMDCRLEEQLLTRRKFELYSPPDTLDGSGQGDSKATAGASTPAFISGRHHMVLDGTTLHNLEVFRNSSGGTEGTLVEHLDRCSTPFGKRLLRSWMCAPLCNPSAIQRRLDAIADLRDNVGLMDDVILLLKTLPDLERMLAKVHTHGLNRQSSQPETRAIYFEETKYNKKKVEGFLAALKGFKTCLEIVKKFKGVRESLTSSLLKGCITTTKEKKGRFPVLDEALTFFDNAFDHDEAQKEGKIVPRSGVDAEYDEAVERIDVTKKSLAEYLKEQCKHFGTKVVYWGNDKKRYQLEVPEHACRRAGDDHELMSQRKGYRRFWTSTTRELLADMITGEEHRNSSLSDIARRIFNQFDQHQKQWEAALQCVATLDVLCSLTIFSREAETVQPEVVRPKASDQPFLEIRNGLHPCLLSVMADNLIPNDVMVGGPADDAHCPLVLITGPNMGGKSTLMRQTALICLLAQLGSYVPADSCRLTPVDRVFTRIGASDRIMAGESTFFVELAETSSILQHANRHSLVLVDELGRGTATYDGTAIASGVVDALARRGCRTLFSTHYHALVDHFTENPNVSLGHMACMVEGENADDPSQETITFLYKFTDGSCPKSYGFNVARLAGLPDTVIRQAREKAKELEMINLKKQAFSRVMSALGAKPGVLRAAVTEAFKSLRMG